MPFWKLAVDREADVASESGQAGPGSAVRRLPIRPERDAMSDAPSPHYPEIPYGWAWFKGIRQEGCLYVDKTRFLHELEREEANHPAAFAMRPGRLPAFPVVPDRTPSRP